MADTSRYSQPYSSESLVFFFLSPGDSNDACDLHEWSLTGWSELFKVQSSLA